LATLVAGLVAVAGVSRLFGTARLAAGRHGQQGALARRAAQRRAALLDVVRVRRSRFARAARAVKEILRKKRRLPVASRHARAVWS